MNNEPRSQESNTIEVAPGIFLPERVAPFWPILRQSEMAFIHIDAIPASDVPVTSSKFGGRPYIPFGHSNPTGNKGDLMMLLAQLNFGEMSNLNSYPNTGLLQFFVDASDEQYGLDFDDQTAQESFKIIYHEDVSSDKADLSTPYWTYDMLLPDAYPPITAEHRLSFRLESECVGPNDSRFKQFFGKDFYNLSRS